MGAALEPWEPSTSLLGRGRRRGARAGCGEASSLETSVTESGAGAALACVACMDGSFPLGLGFVAVSLATSAASGIFSVGFAFGSSFTFSSSGTSVPFSDGLGLATASFPGG